MASYTKNVDAALDVLGRCDGDLIGESDDARELIMALCDQRGLSVDDQERIREIVVARAEWWAAAVHDTDDPDCGCDDCVEYAEDGRHG